jgi:hypothetical protein
VATRKGEKGILVGEFSGTQRKIEFCKNSNTPPLTKFPNPKKLKLLETVLNSTHIVNKVRIYEEHT